MAAVGKVPAEPVRAAWKAGRAWWQIAVTRGLPTTVTTWQEISAALADYH